MYMNLRMQLWPPVPGRWQWTAWEREAFAEASSYLSVTQRSRRGILSPLLPHSKDHSDPAISVDEFSDLTSLSELEEDM